MSRVVRMSKRELEQAIALSRKGNTAEALEKITPKRARNDDLAAAGGRSRGSQRAHASGAEFQAEVRASLETLAIAGLCVYAEGNPRVGGAPGSMFPVEATKVDFQVLTTGIPIAFDCKAVHDRAEISIASLVGTEKAQTKLERQIRYLLDFRRHGGIAFLFVSEPARSRAWLVFQLQTLVDGGAVPLRTLEKERGGIPARIVDHCPALEPNPRPLGPKWTILEAALRYGRKTLPLESPYRESGVE